MRSVADAPGRHLDDGELVRFIDREGSPAERRRWDAHLRACERCRTEAEALRAQSRAISLWLSAADDAPRAGAAPAVPAAGLTAGAPTVEPATAPTAGVRPVPRPRRASSLGAATWLKAAAIVLLLAAPLAAITPVREWVVDRVAVVLGERGERGEPATAPAAGDVDDPLAHVIRFAPADGRFSVVLASAQPAGTLEVGRTGGPEAVLRITGDGPAAEPFVSARLLRIDNPPASRASYTLLVPAGVDVVVVEVGAEDAPVELDPDRAASLPLTPP